MAAADIILTDKSLKSLELGGQKNKPALAMAMPANIEKGMDVKMPKLVRRTIFFEDKKTNKIKT